MSRSGRQSAAGRASTAPPAPPRAPRVDDALLVDALARLVAVDAPAGVPGAVLPLLLALEGVRAAAVVVREGGRAVVLDSAGYGCGPMAPGAALPLDAGLPVTECVRTGRTVLQGSGPSWLAVPIGTRDGALLLSMTGAPPDTPAEQVRLQRLARALGDALHRASGQATAAAELAVVTSRLAGPALPPDVACRSLPYAGPAGGDVALCLPDGRGGRWVVVADVCGSGVPAAVLAQPLQAALTALAPYAEGPAALLTGVDRALRSTIGVATFVTALAVHQDRDRLRVASAGHPTLLLLTASGATAVDVEPGLPLLLESDERPARTEVEVPVPPQTVLLLHTDGLVDRRTPAGPRGADVRALVEGRSLGDLEALADAVLAAADEVGAQGDDATLLLVRSP